jgi:clan AA aspartic protease
MMIAGVVNARIEALIPLVVAGPDQKEDTVKGVIDTGFSGELTLPAAIVAALGLTWLGREPGILADGSTDLFDVYLGRVMWDGSARLIEIQGTSAQPLVGMGLLHGFSLHIDIVEGGAVQIKSIE